MARRRDGTQFIDTFGAVKRTISALANQAYADNGLGQTQVRFLRHLGRHPQISQAELSRATATDPALTGRALQTLIKRGWVLRQRSAADRRGYLLDLGAAGRRALKRVEAVRAELIARVTAPLDERDLADFDRVAAKLLAAFGPTAS